jgi:hypothetical protein
MIQAVAASSGRADLQERLARVEEELAKYLGE